MGRQIIWHERHRHDLVEVTRDTGAGWLSYFVVSTVDGITTQLPAFSSQEESMKMAESIAESLRSGDDPIIPRRPDDNEPSTKRAIAEICDELKDLLMQKNKAYGDSVMDPVTIFSHEDPLSALAVRIDDKLSRVARGHDVPSEDTITDLIGYLILYKIAQRKTA